MSPYGRVDGQLHEIVGVACRVDGELRDVTSAAARSEGGLVSVLEPIPDISVHVETLSPSDIATDSVVLRGNLTVLSGADQATAWFEYREAGASEWQTTGEQTRAQTGTFTDDVAGLSEATEYEYRAQVSAGEGETLDTSTGEVVTFTTGSPTDYTLIDDFEDGVSSSWINTENYATTTASAAEGAQSAYRASGGSIGAAADTFDATLDRGEPFFCTALAAPSGADSASIEFGRDTHEDRVNYGVILDWTNGNVRVSDRPDGSTWTPVATEDVSLAADEWYDVVICWTAAGGVVVWVYDSTGTELARVDAPGLTRDGPVWAIWLDTTGASDGHRVDFVRSRETHPYTGTHYTMVDAYPITIADFESGSLTEWTTASGTWASATGTAQDGTRALELTDSAGTAAEVYSTSGLPHYPEKGDAFRVWHYKSKTNVATRTMYGLSDADSFYAVYTDSPGNRVQFRRYNDGEIYTFQSEPLTHAEGEWLQIEVDWGDDDSHTVNVYDVSGTLQATLGPTTDDTHADATGIGAWSSGGGEGMRWDNWKAIHPDDVGSGTPGTGSGPPAGADPDFEWSFDDSSWMDNWEGGYVTNNFSIVSSPSTEGSGSLRTQYDSGSNYGSSASFWFNDHLGYHPETMYARYFLRFGSDFEPSWDGKLPGFQGRGRHSGNWSESGWGGRPSDGTNGWSCRGIHSNAGSGSITPGYYLYHANMSGSYGNHEYWNTTMGRNQWYEIEQEIEMNTPGVNDGELRAWVDGTLVYERTNLRWRNSGYSNIAIEGYWLDYYHGGSATAPQQMHVYTDHLQLYEDGRP